LADVDGRLQGFNLTEEELPLAFRLGPILDELARRRRYAEISPFAPQADALADAVDDLVLLDAVLDPFGVEWKLLAASLAGLGDGDEVRAYSPLFDDVVRDALLVEAEVPRRLVEGRVYDRVFDGDLSHSAVFLRQLLYLLVTSLMDGG
jgi:hypothetical protein